MLNTDIHKTYYPKDQYIEFIQKTYWPKHQHIQDLAHTTFRIFV